MKLINIGFGNLVNAEKIMAVVNPDAAPIKRLVSKAKEDGTAVDATQGRRTKAVLILDNGTVLLSALQPETVGKRLSPDTGLQGEKEDAGKRISPDTGLQEDKEDTEKCLNSGTGLQEDKEDAGESS